MINNETLNENMKEISQTLEFLKIKRKAICAEINNKEQKREIIIDSLKTLKKQLNEIQGKT